jgi:hypothetical protein
MNTSLLYYFYYAAPKRRADAVRDSYRKPPRHQVLKPPVPQPRARVS